MADADENRHSTVLSLYIETAGNSRKNLATRFKPASSPETDAVVAIGCIVAAAIDAAADEQSVTLSRFTNETQLLSAFRQRFLEADPEVIVGYQCNVVDLWYLSERAKKLGINHFDRLGRKDACMGMSTRLDVRRCSDSQGRHYHGWQTAHPIESSLAVGIAGLRHDVVQPKYVPFAERAVRHVKLHGRHIFDVYEHFTTSSIAVAREWTGGVPVSAAFLDTLTADPDFKLDDLCEPFYDASRMNELGTGLSPAQIIDLLEPTQPAPISPAPDVQAAADSAASAVQAVLPDAVTVAKDCVRSAVLALMLYDVRDDHRVHTYFDHSMYFGWNKSTWDRSWNPVGNRI